MVTDPPFRPLIHRRRRRTAASSTGVPATKSSR
jgi:hypothetical protein